MYPGFFFFFFFTLGKFEEREVKLMKRMKFYQIDRVGDFHVGTQLLIKIFSKLNFIYFLINN